MKFYHKLLMCLAVFLCLIPLAVTSASADELKAEEISSYYMVTERDGIPHPTHLFDQNTRYRQETEGPSHITLQSDKGIGSVYISFGEENTEFSITDVDRNATVDIPAEPFMHRFVDVVELLGQPAENLRIDFPNPVILSEFNVFTEGEVPDWVQKWLPPVEDGADLVLFSTHGDDDQLFFAGILPYYAGELGYKVQVVYFTDHESEPYRFHEMLNGLWAVGVRNYPVAGKHTDFQRDCSIKETYRIYEVLGFTKDDMLGFVVENLRRFKPKVSIGHDVDGEYGHRMHIVYSELLREASEMSGDPNCFPESAEKYGVWDPPKIYLHLYDQNQIVMDWDQPLENFDGKTAYQVTKSMGFVKHGSQYEIFSWYFDLCPKASDIKQWSPCEYGLFRTTVGLDEEKNDFFEHLTTYAEDEAIAEALRAEEEARLAEEKRLEEEAKAAEEAAKAEAEAKAKAEAEAEIQAKEEAFATATSKNTPAVPPFALVYAGLIVLVVGVLLFVKFRRK